MDILAIAGDFASIFKMRKSCVIMENDGLKHGCDEGRERWTTGTLDLGKFVVQHGKVQSQARLR